MVPINDAKAAAVWLCVLHHHLYPLLQLGEYFAARVLALCFAILAHYLYLIMIAA